ncbi:MAG TPA: serine hydrolase domain-containing protein [Allosphingosinicella sp.]|nr:serine hydrolase domain-containing protein [Allosphingosinicella sp.]
MLKRVAAGAGLFLLLIAALWASGLVRFSGAGNQVGAVAGSAAPGVAGAAEVPPVVTSGPSNIDFGRLEARLNELVQKENMVGLAVGIVENGQIRFAKGFGTTAANSQEPVTEQTVFRWASLSKGVAADMVALLASRKQLSLYDPINKYSTTLRLPGGNEGRATVADLLSHRLGIHGHAHDARLEDGQDPKYLRQLLAFLPQQCAPGECHSYQNVGYDAATDIIERLTGKTFEDAVAENMFRPLGMTTASASRQGLVTARSWARPHRGRGARPEDVLEPYYRVPSAGGVNGSIMDLTLWMRAQMGLAPQVLPPDALEAVQSPRVNTPGETRRRRNYIERTTNSAYGLGWRVFNYAGNKVVGHHGGVRGYRSLILFDPARKSGVVALWNMGTSRPNGIEYEVMDMIYGLPFKDWLKLAGGESQAAPMPLATESEETEAAPEGDAARGRPDQR